MTDDPWNKIEERYPKDKEVEGVIVRTASYGMLVRLEPGVEGLIHVSKLGGMTGQALKEREKVEVYIESIDVVKRKISLGLVVSDKKQVIYK
jgi:ribosomal protein S1